MAKLISRLARLKEDDEKTKLIGRLQRLKDDDDIKELKETERSFTPLPEERLYTPLSRERELYTPNPVRADTTPKPEPELQQEEKSLYTKYWGDPTRRAVSNMTSGLYGTVASTADFVGGMTGWQAAKDAGDGLRRKMIEPMLERYVQGDRTFFDETMTGLGSTMTFFVPAAGVFRGVQAIPAIAKWAPVFANVAATAMESAAEAGNVYQQNIEQGKSESDAKMAATRTFLANGLVIYFSNKFSYFADKGLLIKRALLSAPLEGGQEAVQQVIQNMETGRPPFEGVVESAAIGAILGPVVSGTLGIATGNDTSVAGPAVADYTATYKPNKDADEVLKRLYPEGIPEGDKGALIQQKLEEDPEGTLQVVQEVVGDSKPLDNLQNNEENKAYGQERTDVQRNEGFNEAAQPRYAVSENRAGVRYRGTGSGVPSVSISRLASEVRDRTQPQYDGERVVQLSEESIASIVRELEESFRNADLVDVNPTVVEEIIDTLDANVKDLRGARNTTMESAGLTPQERMNIGTTMLEAYGLSNEAATTFRRNFAQMPYSMRKGFRGMHVFDAGIEPDYADSSAYFQELGGGEWLMAYNTDILPYDTRAQGGDVARHELVGHGSYNFADQVLKALYNENTKELMEKMSEADNRKIWAPNGNWKAATAGYMRAMVAEIEYKLKRSGLTKEQALELMEVAGLGTIGGSEFVPPRIANAKDMLKFTNNREMLATAWRKREKANPAKDLHKKFPELYKMFEDNNEVIVDEFRAHYFEGRVEAPKGVGSDNLVVEEQKMVKDMNTQGMFEFIAQRGEVFDLVQRFLAAYHGSPHIHDRFTTEKIGTGEGAQAYGWGLYFTEVKQIAEEYQKKLSQYSNPEPSQFYDTIQIGNLNLEEALEEGAGWEISNTGQSENLILRQLWRPNLRNANKSKENIVSAYLEAVIRSKEVSIRVAQEKSDSFNEYADRLKRLLEQKRNSKEARDSARLMLYLDGFRSAIRDSHTADIYQPHHSKAYDIAHKGTGSIEERFEALLKHNEEIIADVKKAAERQGVEKKEKTEELAYVKKLKESLKDKKVTHEIMPGIDAFFDSVKINDKYLKDIVGVNIMHDTDYYHEHLARGIQAALDGRKSSETAVVQFLGEVEYGIKLKKTRSAEISFALNNIVIELMKGHEIAKTAKRNEGKRGAIGTSFNEAALLTRALYQGDPVADNHANKIIGELNSLKMKGAFDAENYPAYAEELQKAIDVATERLTIERDVQKDLAKDMGEIQKLKEEIRADKHDITYKAELLEQVYGALYEVEIDDDAVQSMLLWDEPMSKQPKVVQDAMHTLFKSYNLPQFRLKDNLLVWVEGNNSGTQVEGREFYSAVRAAMGAVNGDYNSQEHASKWLLEQGVRGVKYLTGNTRNKNKWMVRYFGGGNAAPAREYFDTKEEAEASAKSFEKRNADAHTPPEAKISPPRADYNFVVFDDLDITITKRNGEALSEKEEKQVRSALNIPKTTREELRTEQNELETRIAIKEEEISQLEVDSLMKIAGRKARTGDDSLPQIQASAEKARQENKIAKTMEITEAVSVLKNRENHNPATIKAAHLVRRAWLDSYATEAGYESLEEAEEAVERYRTAKRELADLKAELRENRTERGDLNRVNEFMRKQLGKRRIRIHAVQERYNLTDKELAKIRGKADIRYMNTEEFDAWIEKLEERGEELEGRSEAMVDLKSTLYEKEFRNEENLREQLFGTRSLKKLTTPELRKYNAILENYRTGDKFLTLRKLETVQNTDMAGIRTYREAQGILEEKMGGKLEDMDPIQATWKEQMKWDQLLAETHPLYKLWVDEYTKNSLNAQGRVIRVQKEVNRLFKRARQSRKRGLLDRVAPTDDLIFEWLESENKEAVEAQMMPEEIEAARYVQDQYAQMRDYLIQHKQLERWNKNYVTHIRKSFLENLKDGSVKKAVQSMFDQQKKDEAAFNILDDKTGEILALEKFFRFAQRRSGEIDPSKNVARALMQYYSAFEKKVALDAIIPELDIAVDIVTPERRTKKGLEFDDSVRNLFRRWMNTKKGRVIDVGPFKQGNAPDIALRTAKMFTTLIDLGLSPALAIATPFGEAGASIINTGGKQWARGVRRYATKRGQKITEKYRNFVGESITEEVFRDASRNLPDKLITTVLAQYRLASNRQNAIDLLGAMTEEEWKAGEISTERLAELRRVMGRWRVTEGNKSVIGATGAGSVFTQYKTWALPIITRLAHDIRVLRAKGIKSKESHQELKELVRAVTLMAPLVALMSAYDDDDDSFLGEVYRKTLRDAMSTIGALNPSFWLGTPRLLSWLNDIGQAFETILKLEEYKSGDREGTLKGDNELRRQFTPAPVRQLSKLFEDDEDETTDVRAPREPRQLREPRAPREPRELRTQ